MRDRPVRILDPDRLTAALAVEDLLLTWPQAVRAFARRRMACVGCEVAALHTVADAARAYGVPLDDLLRELRGAAAEEAGPVRGGRRRR